MLAGLLALAAGGAGAAGATLAEHGGAMQAMHGMAGHHAGAMDAEAMEAHFDRHLAEMVPDATAEQKAQLKAIAGRVHAEMSAFHGQLRDAHRSVHPLLLGATVDRAGLEALRVEQLRQLDTASRRLVASIADAAEVLTPEQRRRLAEHMEARPD
jgi:Spy/CpxP family protein refolding chaperone